MPVTIMTAAAVMERKATPDISARRSRKAPYAHSAEVARSEAATAEAARVAAPCEPAASVAAPANPAAPCEAAASVAAAAPAPAGVRSCCNDASSERAGEQNDHHLFQHLNFLS
ncbi:MAG TPA: hypothetical protein VGX95_07130 [Xanthobacteraceae bacterium]|jgi:hypothetical protein|nr:hypothetical protein [Xanthobacteraceae bacterium]